MNQNAGARSVMKNTKLDFSYYHGGRSIVWILDDDDEGATVGQEATTKTSLEELRVRKEKARQQRDDDGWSDFEYLAVEIAAQEWAQQHPDSVFVNGSGYELESDAWAKKFLAAMRAAARSALTEYTTGVPWPEWATTAQAAGWKPPKGWHP